MTVSDGDPDNDRMVRLLDENEQLRTALESSLDENARLIEDRDRLLRRVAVLAQELRVANALHASPFLKTEQPSKEEAEARQSQTDEELRVAFEELQVLAEELEVANTHLQQANNDLEARVATRTRELTNANEVLRRTELRLSTLVNGIPQLVWRSGDGGQWAWSSDQWSAYSHLSDEQSRGLGWLDAFHPDDRAIAEKAWAAATGCDGFSFEARIRNGSDGGYRRFHVAGKAVRTPERKTLEWLGTCTDVDDILQLQEQQSVLVGELQHRTRNLMAIVQAVMLRTIKGSRSLEEFRRCIDDRMDALARVQGLLSRRGSQRIAFDVLLREELSAHVELDALGNSEQVSTSGPTGVPLASSLVQTFALALHELATNAVKYGALSEPAGRLTVRWEVRETPRGSLLHVDWRERGVTNLPAEGAAPRGGGYGRELIERALPYQLGAETSYRFVEDGLHCTIVVAVATDRSSSGTAQ